MSEKFPNPFTEPTQDKVNEEAKPELLSEVEKSFDKLYISYNVMNLIYDHPHLKEAINAICDFDENTRDHVLRVSNFASIVAEKNLAKEEKDIFIKAALLHDVGKIGIEEIKKQGKPSEEEWLKITQHVNNSVDWVNTHVKKDADKINAIIGAHHEFQGKRYPRSGQDRRQEDAAVQTDKRSGEDRRQENINAEKLARKLAIIDAFDAITDKRPGNPAHSIDYARTELEKSFTEEEDQEVINTLTSL